MSHEVFTEPWARAWAGELRSSDAYRRAARTWEGSLLLEMTDPAIALINELFAAYEEMPFGLELEEFTDFAMAQFQRRFARIEKARVAAA